MNKKISCLLCFVLVVSFSLSGCGDKQSSTTSTNDSTNIVGKWELISAQGVMTYHRNKLTTAMLP